MIILRILGFLILIFLPGAWISFGVPIKGISFWLKLIIGIMLAPFLVAIQFFILRIIGISFELTTILLVFINLPAIYFIYMQRQGALALDPQALMMGGIVFIIILISIGPFLLDPQKLLYTWEAWSQADVVYSIANGGLALEDTGLAGVRLSYPYVGQIYQAVISYVSNTPPVTNYIWQNLVW